MKARWEDLATRARGLATHLLDRSDMTAVAGVTGLEELGQALRARGFALPEGVVAPDGLELAVRRRAGARLRLLARWAGARNPLLAVIFEDEDRRSLRSLLRGAVQGAAAALRVAGLIPTPALPERALGELARQPTPRAVAALLTAWGNAYGPALFRAAEAAQPDLLEIEYRLSSTFADRALRGARAARSRILLDSVCEVIDLENACAALVLAGGQSETSAKRAFVEGGRQLSFAAFLDAIAAGDAAGAGQRLAATFRPAPLAAAFARWAGDPTSIEYQLLRHRIVALRTAERHDPASVASVLGFALRVRAEVLDLRRVIWGVTLQAPRGEITGAFVAA